MTLDELNALPEPQLRQELTRCCGARKWVDEMMTIFPVTKENILLNDAQEIWQECTEADWKEAFSHHPKIGDINSLKEKFAATAQWAEGEQAGIKHTSLQVLEAFAESNAVYENKFGYIFIVNASGKSAEEMLSMLKMRLLNTPADELKIAVEEQAKITRVRLKKLLS